MGLEVGSSKAAAVREHRKLLDAMLTFASGAMTFVAGELAPEAKRGIPDIAAMPVMAGFAVMMTLGQRLERKRPLPYTAGVDGKGRTSKGARLETPEADG